MDSPSISTSPLFEEGDNENPTQEPLPNPPPVLEDYPELVHAWKVVNWVYKTRSDHSGIPSTLYHLASDYLLIPGCLGSKKARRKIVQQTGGLILLGLYILGSTASDKFENEPSFRASGPCGLDPLQASGPSGPDPLCSDCKQWAYVVLQVCRRQDWVITYTGYQLILES